MVVLERGDNVKEIKKELTEQEILDFITNDRTSDKKRYARIGQKYYEGDHDIKNYRLFYYDANGEIQEDKTRSNIKISHPFFTELTDQEVQYMMSGKSGFMRSDIPELQNELNEYFNENEDFQSELYDTLTGTVTKGFEYMYAYKNKDDRTSFMNADSLGVVEVRAKDTQCNCDFVIYWYIDKIVKDNKKIKKIQVWNDEQVWYYIQEEEGKLILDECEAINPKPHTIYKKGDKDQLYYENYGFIPFFRLDNCKKQFSSLKPIKDLIDDYDLMSCGLSNNLQDAQEYLVVVNGFQGDNMEELMQNIKTKKHIGVDDGGGVEFKTVAIPYEARQVKLGLDEMNIYRFGMGFNSAQVGDGNVTNVVIKSRYALLDLKCNKLEIKLKQFLRKLLKPVLKEINDRLGTDYQQKDVYIEFEREVMTNASDNAVIEKTKADTDMVKINTLLNLAQTLDNETIVKSICEVLEIDYEQIKDKLPEQRTEEDLLNDAEKELTGVDVNE